MSFAFTAKDVQDFLNGPHVIESCIILDLVLASVVVMLLLL